jgi:hypothetical protein
MWSALGAGTDRVQVLASYDDGSGAALYAAGPNLSMAGGGPVAHIARWDGTAWSEPGGGLAGSIWLSVDDLVVFDDGSGPALFAGGVFSSAGGVTVQNVAKWDGSAWSAVGTGLGDDEYGVSDLVVFDDGSGPALCAAWTTWSLATGFVPHVSRWDGLAWTALGSGPTGGCEALAVFDDGTGPALYAGGTGPVLLSGGSGFARWNGSAWTDLQGVSGVFLQAGPGGIQDLEVFDDGTGPALYAAGAFTDAGGTAVGNVARWDGSSWSALGSGIGGTGIAGQNPPVVVDLQADDQGPVRALHAAGWFTSAGGAPASGIATWEGGSWSDLGGGVTGGGLVNCALGLAVHDDGSGSALHAGGFFAAAGGVPAVCVAKWQARPAPSTYCTAGTSSLGCTPAAGSTGSASASAATGFLVSAAGLEGGRKGTFVFGTSGPAATPWSNSSSTLCAAPPLWTTGVQTATGSPGTCDGALALDFNAWMAAHPAKAPGAGQQVWLQAWARDPLSAAGLVLSDALALWVCP